MAAKIVNPAFPDIDHELRFFLQHYPPAYDVDRTAGTNRFGKTLDNLKHAGSLYGPIIYQKAPIVMRQLELMLRPDVYATDCASTSPASLSVTRHGPISSTSWTRAPAMTSRMERAWVSRPGGRPLRRTWRRERQSGAAFVHAIDPRGRSRNWNQQLQAALGYGMALASRP